MRNIVNIDYTNVSCCGAFNSAIDGNELMLCIRPLATQLTGLRIEITDSSGVFHLSGEIVPSGGLDGAMVEFIVSISYWNVAGTMKVRLQSNEGNSAYTNFTCITIASGNDVCCKYSGGNTFMFHLCGLPQYDKPINAVTFNLADRIYISRYPAYYANMSNIKQVVFKLGGLKFNTRSMVKINLGIYDYANTTDLCISFYCYSSTGKFYLPSCARTNAANNVNVYLGTDANDYVYIKISYPNEDFIHYPTVTIDQVVCSYALPQIGTLENDWMWSDTFDFNTLNRVVQCTNV